MGSRGAATAAESPDPRLGRHHPPWPILSPEPREPHGRSSARVQRRRRRRGLGRTWALRQTVRRRQVALWRKHPPGWLGKGWRAGGGQITIGGKGLAHVRRFIIGRPGHENVRHPVPTRAETIQVVDRKRRMGRVL